ncbi:MAG: hypothetical protein R6V35_04635 [Candidatus Nanohaloarchaea archaeon]
MNDQKVIDNYLIWEICKQEGLQRKISEASDSGENLIEEVIEKIRQEYREKDHSLGEKKQLLQELDNNPDYRSKIFEECSWKKRKVKVEDLGTTLPRAGDLPPEVITGTLLEVVEWVKNADPEESQSVRYIHNLKQVPEVLNQFYPWVVTPGNRPEKLDRMKEVHGERNWDIEDTWGMINDGNHRAIAKILADDSQEIECYVGRPK